MAIGWVFSRYISDFSNLFPSVIYASLYLMESELGKHLVRIHPNERAERSEVSE